MVTFGGSCVSPRSLPAAHRDHESVPGCGEDLSTLVPTIVPLQLRQEVLRLDLWNWCQSWDCSSPTLLSTSSF